MTIKHYVLGFAFDEAMENVVLIKKERPQWQAGKLNGVGGKVETIDATPRDAMIREFYEETGVPTNDYDWFLFATMNFSDDVMGGGAKIWVFKAVLPNITDCSTFEDEEIMILSMATIYTHPLMHNLRLLLPLCFQDEFEYTEFKQKYND